MPNLAFITGPQQDREIETIRGHLPTWSDQTKVMAVRYALRLAAGLLSLEPEERQRVLLAIGVLEPGHGVVEPAGEAPEKVA